LLANANVDESVMGGTTGREDIAESLYRVAVLRRVLTNTSIYAAGEVLGRLAVFALVPIYTVLLPPEELAVWGLGAMLMQGLTVLYGMGTQAALPQFQYPLLDRPDELRRTNGSIAIFLLVWGPALHLLLEAVAPALLERWLPGLPWAPHGRLISLTCLAGITAIVPIARWTTTERPRPFVAASLGRSLVELSATLTLLLATDLDVLSLFLGRFLAHGLLSLPLAWVTARSVQWSLRIADVRAVLTFALPLVPDLLAAWALTMSDRVLLAWLSDDRQLGLYTAAYWFPLALGLVAINANRAWAPRFHKNIEALEAQDGLRRSTTAFLLGMGWLGLAVAALAPDVVRVAFGPEYREAAGMAAVLGLIGPMLGVWQVGVAPLYAKMRRFAIPLATGSAALAGVLLNLWAIPRYGALGAAWSTVASYGVLAVAVWIAGRTLPRAPIDPRALRFGILAGAPAFVVVLSVDGWLPGPWWGAVPLDLLILAAAALLVRTQLRDP